MKKFFLLKLICMMWLQYAAIAQYNYFPFYSADTAFRSKLSNECRQKICRSFILPARVNAAYKKEFNLEKDYSGNYTKSLVRYSGLTDSVLNPFVQSVFLKIANANSGLEKYTIVLSDWPVLNAAYVGGNVIILYAPLLSRLENESQVAAVLCHELAHGELDHVQQGLKKRLDEIYSKEFQKELKKTMKEEFNLQKKIDLLALKFTFGNRYHTRSLEKAADSLGYLFLSKSAYNPSEAVGTLQMLRQMDEPVYKDAVNYAEFFKCPSSAFDFTKIKPYKFTSIFNVTSENPALEDSLRDSLRSHPDCGKRIGFIHELMKTHPPDFNTSTDSLLYKKIQWAAAMEMIMGFYKYGYYDHSLFNALLYYQNFADNEFLKTMIVLNWYHLYDAMKKHELADYVSNYSEENPTELNNLLFTVNSLRLQEISEFIRCFHKSNNASFKENEFAIALGYCMSIINEDGKAASWQQKYKAQFKDGKFTALLDLKDKTDAKKRK